MHREQPGITAPDKRENFASLNNIVEQDHRALKRRAEGRSGIPSVRLGVANGSGYRDDEHDPKRTRQMVAKE